MMQTPLQKKKKKKSERNKESNKTRDFEAFRSIEGASSSADCGILQRDQTCVSRYAAIADYRGAIECVYTWPLAR